MGPRIMFLAWGLCVVAMQKAQLVGVVNMTASKPTSLTGELGVYGWREYDTLILAALALEAPVLLVGSHGTAKTLLVERLAEALGGSFRHYNASLINYDDLVGIPYPDEAGGLKFIGSQSSIWGATFTFFDEVNRCRPDLQNKMFPIIHERKVAGVSLPDLRHRWAAMNPPSAVDGVGEYVGVEPLDLALADRFWLTIKVPTWSSLTREERTSIVESRPVSPAASAIPKLIESVRKVAPSVESGYGEFATGYVVSLADILTSKGIMVSSRRSAVLRKLVLFSTAATSVLGENLDLPDLLERLLRSGLPQWSDPVPPDLATVLAAHRQALDLAKLPTESHKRRIFEETDLIRRVNVALEVSAEETLLATTVLGALASLPTEAHKVALSAVFAESLRERTLTPAAWSAIGENAARVKRVGVHQTQEAPGHRLDSWRRASAWLSSSTSTSESEALIRAIVSSCGPDLIHKVNLDTFLEDIKSYLELFPLEASHGAR